MNRTVTFIAFLIRELINFLKLDFFPELLSLLLQLSLFFFLLIKFSLLYSFISFDDLTLVFLLLFLKFI